MLIYHKSNTGFIKKKYTFCCIFTNSSVQIYLPIELLSTRQPLYDRCSTLEIQRDPWLNGIGTNQCNHAGVWGDRGTKGHSLSACSAGAPGEASRTSPASAWNGRQLTDLASATLPSGPHRCLAKSPGRSALRARPRRVWWMPRLACWGGCTTTGFKCSVSRPLKSPLSFSVMPNMSCRAYLKIYSLSMSHLTAASSSSSLPSCTQLLPLLFPCHTLTPFVRVTSMWVASEVIHLSANTNLSTSRCTHWLWVGGCRVLYTVRWGPILVVHVHSTPGLNESRRLRMQITNTVTCMLYYIPTNRIYCR